MEKKEIAQKVFDNSNNNTVKFLHITCFLLLFLMLTHPSGVPLQVILVSVLRFSSDVGGVNSELSVSKALCQDE